MECRTCGHSGADQVENLKPCKRCGSTAHWDKAPEPVAVEIPPVTPPAPPAPTVDVPPTV